LLVGDELAHDGVGAFEVENDELLFAEDDAHAFAVAAEGEVVQDFVGLLLLVGVLYPDKVL
jgi:hypothetical protein